MSKCAGLSQPPAPKSFIALLPPESGRSSLHPSLQAATTD